MGVLENKVVVVTGAGSGLGKDTAILFAREGAYVAACDVVETKVDALREDLADFAEQVLVVKADVSKEKDVRQLIQEAYAKFGRIDIVINNAATFENYLISETTIESWNSQFENNVTSVFLMTKECLPIMRKQKSGQFLNITTSLAQTGGAGFGPYSASKAALETLSYTVQEEEGRYGIQVHVINPGVMRSDMQTTGADPALVASKLVEFSKQNNRHVAKVVHLDV